MADTAGFRMELVHANSFRAGYLDMDGCTIVDLLPRYRVPGFPLTRTPTWLLWSSRPAHYDDDHLQLNSQTYHHQ